MTRTEYLAKLEHYLKRLPQVDYQEAMDYFTEYFDEAGPENEAQVIAELGSPKEAASDLINRLLDEKIVDDTKTPRKTTRTVWIAILAILGTPLSLPLVFILFALLITILAVGFAVVITVLMLGVAFLTSGLYMLYDSWSYLSISTSTTTLGLGIGLLSIGLSILAIMAAVSIAKLSGQCIIALAKHTVKKRR